jgi:predicted permease
VLCLATGIAACALAWHLIDITLLRPHGIAGARDLVVVWEANPARQQDHIEVSLPDFLDWQHETRTLERMAAYGSTAWPVIWRIEGEPISLSMRAVTRDFFGTLGVAPALGRTFDPGDLEPGVPPAVVLSHRLWQTRLGGDMAAVGRTIEIDGEHHRVIGVMPRGFAFPEDPDVWISAERVLPRMFGMMTPEAQRTVGILDVVARRRAGVAREDVRAELTAVVRSVRERHGRGDAGLIASVMPLTEVVLGRLGARLWIAAAMAAAVFLLGCANVAAVRWVALRERAQELWVRRILGSSGTRLASGVALEMLPLVGAATLLAVAMQTGLMAQVTTMPVVARSGAALAGDGVSDGLAIGVLALAAFVLVGVVPAVGVALWLSEGHAAADTRVARRSSRLGARLLAMQAALAVAVVLLASVALQAFDRLSRSDPGFSARHDITLVDLTVPRWKYRELSRLRQLFERLHAQLASVPGVQHAGGVSVRPFRFGDIADPQPIRRAGDVDVRPDSAVGTHRVIVTPGYFEALGIRLLAGRAFTGADRASSPRVAIVSETLARTLFGERDPRDVVGRQIEMFAVLEQWRPLTIVGVADNARYRGLELPPLEVYVPFSQAPPAIGSFVIAARPGAVVSADSLRRALHAVEPEVAVETIRTARQIVDDALSPARLLAALVAMLATVGLALLVLGVTAAAGAAVRAAWGEIGLRQAMGATPVRAVRAPLRSLLRAVLFGTAAGLALGPPVLSAAAALGWAPASSSVWALAVAAAAVMGAAVLGVLPSARRAAQIPLSDLLRSP